VILRDVADLTSATAINRPISSAPKGPPPPDFPPASPDPDEPNPEDPDPPLFAAVTLT